MKNHLTGFHVVLCFCFAIFLSVFIAPFEKPIVKNVAHFYIPVQNEDGSMQRSAWMNAWKDLHQLVS